MLIDEIASGINEKRKGLHKLINLVFQGQVERILIEYKDRLARFGYEYIWAIFRNLGVNVEIIQDKTQKYEEELAEDILPDIMVQEVVEKRKNYPKSQVANQCNKSIFKAILHYGDFN